MPSPAERLEQPIVIAFNHCEVHVYSPDYLETVFPDGTKCPALFSYDQASVDLANHLGYGTDTQAVRRMHFDHELGHTFLAEQEGQRYSPVLRGVACPDERPPADARSREEHRVLAFQSRLNGNDVDTQSYLQRYGAMRPHGSPSPVGVGTPCG